MNISSCKNIRLFGPPGDCVGPCTHTFPALLTPGKYKAHLFFYSIRKLMMSFASGVLKNKMTDTFFLTFYFRNNVYNKKSELVANSKNSESLRCKTFFIE